MSLNIPQASQQGLFKQGYNSYDAEDGAVIRNVGFVPTSPTTAILTPPAD
jgi:T-complex protein 1 subunit theta